jgi:hypothetical protein
MDSLDERWWDIELGTRLVLEATDHRQNGSYIWASQPEYYQGGEPSR